MKCPTCGDDMKTVPAGITKNRESKNFGKPYRAFEVCEKDACKEIKKASYNRNSTNPSIQTTYAPDLKEKVEGLEQTIAKIRVAYSDLNKRLQGLETLVEGMTSKEAKEFHQSFPEKDVRQMVEDAGIPVINTIPWEEK